MNNDFLKVLAAPIQERRGLFLASANRLGVPLGNIEKDFWVCWILDLLFNSRKANEFRLLFKGGTSLSKAHSLISRFSEDIDITVFREDINQNIPIEELERLSGKQQRKYLDNIKTACQEYIKNQLKPHLESQIKYVFENFDNGEEIPSIILDQTDSSQQTILVRYPSVDIKQNDYIVPAVKIESGAKSALDPHQSITISPYVSQEIIGAKLDVNNVITIDAERTFWDKVIILHGIRRWYDLKGILRQNGHRFSRHYYDINQLMNSNVIDSAKSNSNLAIDCIRHAQMFFNSPGLDLKSACSGSYSLVPIGEMKEILMRDYQAMQGMIFGDIPDFSEIIDSIYFLECELNKKED